MKNAILHILSTIGALLAAVFMGPPLARARTTDISFTFGIPSGFPGTVTRTHPASIFPGLTNTANPPVAYGVPLIVAADGTLRGVIAADGSTTPRAIEGFLVRPYPTQQTSGGMSASIGAAVPPASGVLDYLQGGTIMAKLPPGATVVKGGQVFVWAAATSGNNIQGQLVAAASGTNTVTITNAEFVGAADAQGNVEVQVWPLR